MEDVLAVYHQAHDAKRPVVCRDETFTQLIGETQAPLPPAPGQVERYDCVDVRNGRGPRQARLGGVGAPPACFWRSSLWLAGGR
jgi:hypothetical protein